MELRMFGYYCPASGRKCLFGVVPDSQICKAPSCCLKRVVDHGTVHQNNHDGQDTPCLKQEKSRTHLRNIYMYLYLVINLKGAFGKYKDTINRKCISYTWQIKLCINEYQFLTIKYDEYENPTLINFSVIDHLTSRDVVHRASHIFININFH